MAVVMMTKEYYARNREHLLAAAKARRQDPAVRERDAATMKAYRETHPRDRSKDDNTRQSWLRRLRLLGLTEADYDRMLTEQGGRCRLCRCDEPWSRSDRWAVDHDHSTGRVRGLLCHPCNKALGLFRDDPIVLRAAADYVERAR